MFKALLLAVLLTASDGGVIPVLPSGPPPMDCAHAVLGEFGVLTIVDVMRCLPEAQDADFSLTVDGPGSTTHDLQLLHNVLVAWERRGHKLHCRVAVEADSGCAYLFESDVCTTRTMAPGSKLGIHHVVVEFTRPVEFTLAELQDFVNEGRREETFLFGRVAERMDGGTVEKLRARVEATPDGMLMFTADEALAAGLTDAVQ
jgi:hypothetical protein